MSSGTSTENNVNDRDEEIAPLLSTGESIINVSIYFCIGRISSIRLSLWIYTL